MIMISAMVMPDHNIATTPWDIVPVRGLVSDLGHTKLIFLFLVMCVGQFS